MDEIKSILKKHDIAAFVVLHTPGFSEYLNHVMTSYSCAKVEPDGIHLKIKESEIGRDKAKLLAEGTYNMIVHLTKHIGNNAMMYMTCEEALTKKFGGTKDDGIDTSHEQQNN